MLRLITLCCVLLLLAACGGQPAEPTPPVTPVADAATPSDPEPTALPEATAVPPTPEPEDELVADCDQQFDQLVTEYSQDLAACGEPAALAADACPLPESTISSQPLQETINIQILLDASGSMGDPLGEATKLEVAQAVLTDFVATLPEDANVALRVFGHTGSRDEADKVESCTGSELFYPFQPLDAESFINALESFEPVGWTPTAAALQAAGEDFSELDAAQNSNFVYLISDGLETCEGDPAAAAAQLQESNIGVTVNVVGFDVDSDATAELQATAERGGGSYFAANDGAALREVFIEQIDWEAWGEYRACLVDTVAAAFTDEVNLESEIFSCSMQTVSDETNAMLAALAEEPQYAACSSELSQRLLDRQTELHTNLAAEFQARIDAAESEFEDEVDEADQPDAP